MSQIFSHQFKIPANVTISYQQGWLQLTSSEYIQHLKIPDIVQVHLDENKLTLTAFKYLLQSKQYFFLSVSLIRTSFRGMIQPFKLHLVLNGIGFKVKKINNQLIFKLGFSHDLIINIPSTISVLVVDQNKITLSGRDWNQLTQFASKLKHCKKGEPYKGKGILLKHETILRKEGKKSKK